MSSRVYYVHAKNTSPHDTIMNVKDIINQFEREQQLVDQDLADMISDELSRRELPPTSLARNTLYYWRTGQYQPNVLMLEWLAANAADDRLRYLAAVVLSAMTAENDA